MEASCWPGFGIEGAAGHGECRAIRTGRRCRASCGSFDAGHDALMTLYRNRFAGQIELVNAEELMSLWREGS
jgi:hypothetical protein